MSQLTDEEADGLLAKFAKREAELKREDSSFGKKLDAAERLIRYAWALGTLVVIVAVWVAKQQWDGSERNVQLAELIIRVSALEKEHWDDKGSFTEIRNTIDGNKRERIAAMETINRDISSLKDLQPKVTEMWFMKEHGITNIEENQRKPHPAP